MLTGSDQTDASDRLDWFEYPSRDFPYYNGRPTRLTGRQWLAVMLGVAVGFLALVLAPPWGAVIPFVGAIAFSAIPLVVLHAVAGPGWIAIFQPVGWRDLMWAIVFALLNILVSAGVGIVMMKTVGSNSNAIFGDIAKLDGLGLLLIYLRTGIQLFGEEVFSVLPFLTMLWYFHAERGLRRKPAVVLAWFGCALWFGAAHLPTYGWNFVQALMIIGLARIILLLAYLKTKNILVSFGAHLLTDWTYFSVPLILAAHPLHST